MPSEQERAAQHYGARLRRPYQPKTGEACYCKPGAHRDNCPECEGTGMKIDFRAIHARRLETKP